ncbi:MAG: MFS transporter [Candidatus Obscuribacter sp.]|nr:MFS transporter [Candidatus Obscuribacter sp.]
MNTVITREEEASSFSSDTSTTSAFTGGSFDSSAVEFSPLSSGTFYSLASLAPEAAPAVHPEMIQKKPGVNPWHAFAATWLGGVFDGMDSSIFAIVLYPCLCELLHTKSHVIAGQFGSYIVAMFMVGWAIGAVFFGWLADRIGRAKTLTITILLYALFTGLCAVVDNGWQLGLFRLLVGAGIGGEMGIGAVLLSECWPKKTRVYALSALATSLGVGYIITDWLNIALKGDWRMLFLVGVVPAFLTVYMRLKLKDSDHFHEEQEKREKAAAKLESERTDADRLQLSNPFKALLDKENFAKTLIVGTLTSSAIICWWAVLAWIPAWINQITGTMAVEARSHTMLCKDLGMILSGVMGGFLISKFGYKKCMSSTFVLAFVFTVGMFMSFKSYSQWIFPCILGVGFFAHLPFVLLWSYIPELYNTRIRSTAFGVTYNMGRLWAAGAALGSGVLISVFGGSYAMAASTVALIFLLGAAASLAMPKPTGRMIE